MDSIPQSLQTKIDRLQGPLIPTLDVILTGAALPGVVGWLEDWTARRGRGYRPRAQPAEDDLLFRTQPARLEEATDGRAVLTIAADVLLYRAGVPHVETGQSVPWLRVAVREVGPGWVALTFDEPAQSNGLQHILYLHRLLDDLALVCPEGTAADARRSLNHAILVHDGVEKGLDTAGAHKRADELARGRAAEPPPAGGGDAAAAQAATTAQEPIEERAANLAHRLGITGRRALRYLRIEDAAPLGLTQEETAETIKEPADTVKRDIKGFMRKHPRAFPNVAARWPGRGAV